MTVGAADTHTETRRLYRCQGSLLVPGSGTACLLRHWKKTTAYKNDVHISPKELNERVASGLKARSPKISSQDLNMLWTSPFHKSSSSPLLSPRSQATPNPAAYRGTVFLVSSGRLCGQPMLVITGLMLLPTSQILSNISCDLHPRLSIGDQVGFRSVKGKCADIRFPRQNPAADSLTPAPQVVEELVEVFTHFSQDWVQHSFVELILETLAITFAEVFNHFSQARERSSRSLNHATGREQLTVSRQCAVGSYSSTKQQTACDRCLEVSNFSFAG